MYNPLFFWFSIAIVFLVIEMLSPHLGTLWFAIGALISMLAWSFGVVLYGQIIIFFIVSIILLLLLRPIYKKYIKVNIIKTNAQSLIGEIGVVISDITDQEFNGLVKIKGQIWSAKSNEFQGVISKGERVRVLAIEGVKLIVEKGDDKL